LHQLDLADAQPLQRALQRLLRQLALFELSGDEDARAQVALGECRAEYGFGSASTNKLANSVSAANDQIMRLGNGLLQARHVAGERQHAHAASLPTIASQTPNSSTLPLDEAPNLRSRWPPAATVLTVTRSA
jgi:hypothetical protein